MKIKTLAATSLLFVAVTACGSGGATSVTSSSSAGGAVPSAAPAEHQTPITVKDFTLEPKQVTVSGQAALAVTNAGPTIHNVTIRDASGTVVAATKDLRAGQSEALSFDIPAGTYTLYCSLPGHESLGIKGTLIVSP
jgi:plastocyanin